MEESHGQVEQLQLFFPHQRQQQRNNSLMNTLQNTNDEDLSNAGSTFVDSGYTSCQYTPNSSYTTRSFNASSSIARHSSSVLLAPIDEDIENVPGAATNIVTPTTACFNKILALSLTSPKVSQLPQKVESIFERKRSFIEDQKTPTKNLVDYRFGDGVNLTPLRTISPNQKSLCANITPKKIKPTLKRKHSSTFRDRLYLEDEENSEVKNCLEPDYKKLNQATEISPIFNNRVLRQKNTDITNLMRSSTPKTAGIQSHFYTQKKENTNWDAIGMKAPEQVKNKLFRKFQSFSPSKIAACKKVIPIELSSKNKKEPIAKGKPKLTRQNAFVDEDSLNNTKQSSFNLSTDFDLTRIKSKNFSELFEAPIIGEIEVKQIKTPRKSTIKKPPNRLGSRSSSVKKVQQQQRHQHSKRSFYGVEKLDILKRLDDRNIPAVDIILSYLTDSDLVNVVLVSKNWQNIILNHTKLNKRLKDFIRSARPMKENRKHFKNKVVSFSNDLCDKKKIIRRPFSACNSNSVELSGERRCMITTTMSPPVSPSKRKFRENQKIASLLKKSAQLTTCPRCTRPSKITLLSKNKRGAVSRAYTVVEQQQHTKDDLMQSPSTKIRRKLFATSVMRAKSMDSSYNIPRSNKELVDHGSDYAECTGQNCGYKFCIKCFCEYHKGFVCADLAPNSPSKEEERKNKQNIPCTKQSKKSLFRLCK